MSEKYEALLALPPAERGPAMKGWKMDDIVGFMAYSQAKTDAALAEAQAKVTALQAKGDRAITVKVSEKGAFSAYGLGRFPVSLYDGQWEKLAKAMPEILAFVKANQDHPNVKAAHARKEGK